VVSSQRHGGELVQPQGGAAVSGGRTSNARIQRGGLARRFNSERMTYLPRCGRMRVRPNLLHGSVGCWWSLPGGDEGLCPTSGDASPLRCLVVRRSVGGARAAA
jgi:hypothetical protein